VDQKVNFTDQSEDPEGKMLSYSWNFDDGSTLTEKNPSHKYEKPGAYTVKLTVTDDEGAKATRPMTITVSKLSSAITCSISSSEITEGDSITVYRFRSHHPNTPR